MKKVLLFFQFSIFLFLVAGASAQNPSNIQNMEEEYFQYFELNRETLFLHLNKTTIIPNEDLWLSAYVYNTKTESPNLETANLKIAIYDEKGAHLRTHTIHVSNGKGSAALSMDPDLFPPGSYYLKAFTEYMDNFSEDLTYIQPFQILGEKANPTTREMRYDLHVLPEGGHLLEGSINSVGVKLIDQNGFGTAFSRGRVLDSEGTNIQGFTSNRFGMGRFFFTPVPGQEYRLVLTTVDGQEIIQKLPAAKEKGINVVSTQRKNDFLLSIRTNEKTLQDLEDKKFLFIVHKDGKLKDFEVSFPQGEQELNIVMSKDSLFPGVNFVTIFDNHLNPLVERIVFNEQTLKRKRLHTSVSEKSRDSINFNFRSREVSDHSLSVSVLPFDTKAFAPAHNILSAFYLKPYIKGEIDEPLYYFSEGNEKRKLYDLDLLLLTQGWSRYDWSDFERNSLKELHPHETGFTITGKLEKRNKNRHQNLFIGSDEFFEITEITGEDSFTLEQVYVTDSTELQFGLMNERNSNLDKPQLRARVLPDRDQKKPGQPIHFSSKFYYSEEDNIPRTYAVDFDVLDTVSITGKRHIFDSELQIHERGIEITDEIAKRFHHISDFIATKGFQVRYIQGHLEIRTLTPSSFGQITPGRADGGARTASSNVMLYLNGAPVGTDPSFMNRLQTSEVKSIIINKRGYGYGGMGANGVIHINLKQGSEKWDNKERVLTVLANNGYTPDKQFYTPKYMTINTDAYKKYGAIDWVPNLILKEQGGTQISLPTNQSVRLFVQGMGADGSLISEEFVVKKN